MPRGLNQSNYLLHFTMDVLQDKVYYNEKEYPAGYFAASILNAPDDVMSKMLPAGREIRDIFSYPLACTREVERTWKHTK